MKNRPQARGHRPEVTAIPAAPAFFGVEPRLLNAWTGALWAAWAAAALWAYFSQGHSPFFSLDLWLRVLPPVWDMSGPLMLGHGLRLLKLTLFILSCAGLGRAALRAVFGAPSLNSLETAAFSYGLGTGAVGTLMVALGLAGLWKTPVILGLSFAALAAAVWLNRDMFRATTPSPSLRSSSPRERGEGSLLEDPWTWPMAAITALALGVTGFYALAPELFYDSLVYHLATPALYQLSGGLVATPTNLYTGFPMHAEMLFGWALFAGDSALAKLVHWSMGLGITASVLGLAARSGRPRAGWTACAIFLATPLVGLSLFKTAVEACSATMVLLSAQALLLWLDAPESSPERRGLWALSAVFTGLAMATKYTNWPVLGVLGACFLVLRVPPRALAGYASLALAFIAPWVAKNLWFYGNPVFPYLQERFRPGAEYPVNWRSLQSDAWGRDWGDLLARGGRSLFEVFAHPWFMSVRGASDADFLGPLFLIGLPALAVFRPAGRHGRLLLGLLFGLWMLWWPMTAMPRFFMPGLVLLSLWIAWAVESLPGFWRKALTVAAVPLMLNNVFWVALSTYQLDTWPVTISGAGLGSFLNHSHPTYPTPYYSAAEWINQNAPENARVLVVGDGRAFYLERPFLAASALDNEILPLWLKASPDAGALKSRMDREGITYLLVNVGELVRLKRDPMLGPRELDVLDAFLKRYSRRRHEDVNKDPRDFRWETVYELSERPQGPPEEGSALLGWYRQVLQNRK